MTRYPAGRLARILIVGAGVALSACATTPPEAGGTPGDPFEAQNREIHAFNKALDRNAVRPLSEAYAAAVPAPARRGVSNAVSNLGEPLNVVNHSLQGDVEDAGTAFFRLAVNTFFGFGGLIDTATDMGIYERDTDFGETMAVWGVPEGAYLELPVFGPSTTRDAAGRVVDIVINPVSGVLDDGREYLIAARAVDILQTRQDLKRVIDALLYESADSYAAARIAYLQNRARSINTGLSEDALEDPYAFE